MVDPEAIATDFLQQWQRAISNRQADQLAALFTDDALFVATAPMPLIGRTEIAAYYRAIPPGLAASAVLKVATSAERTEVRAVAEVRFSVPEREPMHGRLTLTLMQHFSGLWQVALYHAAIAAPA